MGERSAEVKRSNLANTAQGEAAAQLGEHHVRNVGVEGSSPFRSTISFSICIESLDYRAEEQPALLGVPSARFEEGDVHDVAGRGALRKGDLLEAQEILLGGDVEEMRADPGSRRAHGELRRGKREVEEQIDS